MRLLTTVLLVTLVGTVKVLVTLPTGRDALLPVFALEVLGRARDLRIQL